MPRCFAEAILERQMPTIVERLAEYAVQERERSLPSYVLHHAKRAVIDWFACLLPGAIEAPAKHILEALRDEVGVGKAHIYGTALRASIRTAALINGTASHTIEFDDIFRDALYHPGAPVISAALAAAQAKDADGLDLLKAIIVGYEVSTRVGVAVQPSHYRYWHTTGTIGTIGAAAAVASIYQLDKIRMAHALATSATMAAALQQAFRSDAMSKPLHAGHAAEAGALAAMIAGHDFTGALDVLEGEAGFGAGMSAGANWNCATEDLGNLYNIEKMTFKNHGCCGHCFASIDAVLALRPCFDIAEIKKITVATYKAAIDVTNRRMVKTAFDGRFSTPFTVSTALVHGSVRLNAFTPERLQDSTVQALMGLVEMVVDPGCDAGFPVRRSSFVTIELRDGSLFQHLQQTRRGDPDDPLSDEELAAKYLELTSPILKEEKAQRLLQQLLRLDRASAEEIVGLGQ